MTLYFSTAKDLSVYMPQHVSLSLIPEWIQEYQQIIASYIEKEFSRELPELDNLGLQELEGSSRIRAVLTLLWCEALDGDVTTAIPVAVAYELAHAAALIQDDIIDGSETRHGEKTLVAKHGVAKSLLASNALLFKVPKLLAESTKKNATVDTATKLLEVLGECCHEATLGEFLDLELAKRETVTEEEYLQMVRKKTGALVAASCVSGAILGCGVQKENLEIAFGFGEFIGTAYQIRDDVMDILGSEAALGKPAFTDLQSGKTSLVLIHLLKFCTAEEKRFVLSLKEKGLVAPRDAEVLRMLVTKYGSSKYATHVATANAENAIFILEQLNDSTARRRLQELSNFLIQRLA